MQRLQVTYNYIYRPIPYPIFYWDMSSHSHYQYHPQLTSGGSVSREPQMVYVVQGAARGGGSSTPTQPYT